MSDVKHVEISVWTPREHESAEDTERVKRMHEILRRNCESVTIDGDHANAQVPSDVVGVLLGWLREYGSKYWIVRVAK